jgi:hypothetical protein
MYTPPQAVLDMVVSHQGLPLKLELVKRILSTLVLPSPVPYRSLLRRFAALSSKSTAEVGHARPGGGSLQPPWPQIEPLPNSLLECSLTWA